MIRLMFAALLVTATGSPAYSQTLKCKLTSYSAKGWSKPSAAKEFFPPDTVHILKGDTVVIHPWKVRGTVTRSANRVRMHYRVAVGTSEEWIVTYTYVPGTGALTATMKTGYGYEQLGGAQGACKK